MALSKERATQDLGGREFEPHLGCRDYLNKYKTLKKSGGEGVYMSNKMIGHELTVVEGKCGV